MITVTEIVELEDVFELRNLLKDSPAINTIDWITAAHKSEEFMQLLEDISEDWDFDDLEAYLLTDYIEIFRNLGMVEGEDFARGDKKRINHFNSRSKGYLIRK